MIIDNFKGFSGEHCETTATGSLLRQIGIDLSEAMLFGLGEGLSFIFWKMKTMDFPFLGGRIKTDALTANICEHLKLQLEVKETSSVSKAWSNVKEQIDRGVPVGLKLDSYYLDYFTSKIHFAGHYTAIYGYDEEYGYLQDTQRQGGKMKAKLSNLEKARNAKGPMSSRNLSYTISGTHKMPVIDEVLPMAIRRNAEAYLNPPIKNISYKGIRKTAAEVKKWFKESKNVHREFTTSADLMEKAGTGGAIFRNFYRDFLKESSLFFSGKTKDILTEGHARFSGIAADWTKVAQLFYKIGSTEDEKYLPEVSTLLTMLSEEEKEAMELLAQI